MGADFDRPGGRRRDPDHEDVVGNAREHLPAEACAAELVLDGGDSVVQVEGAPVAGDLLLVVAAEEERHVCEHLVARLPVGHSEHRELGQRVRLLRPPLQQQAPHVGERTQGVGIVAVVWPARPDALLVDDERLLVDPPEHARAQATVADRERCEPPWRRRPIPETEIPLGHPVAKWSRPGSRITAAISRGSRGTCPVRFSIPSSVTTTVSSHLM